MAWQLQEAKAKFSELVQKAIDEGPQTVTRHGKDAVVVVSAEEFELMQKRQIDLKELLRRCPLEELELERDETIGARDRLVRYLLDTNVISEVRKQERCHPNVAAWYDSVRADEPLSSACWSSARFGQASSELRAAIRRRARRVRTLAHPGHRSVRRSHLCTSIAGSRSSGDGSNAPRRVPPIDGLLAATALVHGLTLVTRNVEDFARPGVSYLNPFEPLR